MAMAWNAGQLCLVTVLLMGTQSVTLQQFVML